MGSGRGVPFDVMGCAKLAHQSGEKLTPRSVIGWVEFQEEGNMGADVDGGEDGSRVGGRYGWW